MANSKKSKGKTVSKSTSQKANANDRVEARPIGEGLDPLAVGERIYNETNTSAETHYKADDSELKAEEQASKIRGKNADQRAEEHNAQGGEDLEVPMREEAQALHEEVTNRTDEEQAEESAAREKALAQDPEVKGKLK